MKVNQKLTSRKSENAQFAHVYWKEKQNSVHYHPQRWGQKSLFLSIPSKVKILIHSYYLQHQQLLSHFAALCNHGCKITSKYQHFNPPEIVLRSSLLRLRIQESSKNSDRSSKGVDWLDGCMENDDRGNNDRDTFHCVSDTKRQRRDFVK